MPVSKGTQTPSRYFFTRRSTCRIASNSADTRIFLATRKELFVSIDLDLRVGNLAGVPEQAEFHLQNDGAFGQALPCPAMGTASAAMMLLFQLFEMSAEAARSPRCFAVFCALAPVATDRIQFGLER